MGNVSFEEAYPLALRAARVRAVSSVLSGVIPASDREDLEQEGLFAVLRALPQFEPDRAGLRTFCETVIASHLASLDRARRSRPHLVQLGKSHDQGDDGFGAEVELRADVQLVLDALPRLDRRIALSLTEHSAVETSRLLNVSRSTVYRRIRRLRAAFAEAGLEPEEAPKRIAA